jgi:hypothetical protein
MSDNGFDLGELDAFRQQLAEVANEYPATAEKHLRRIGNKFKKIIKEKSPDSGQNHKNKLNKSWKSEVKGFSGEALSMDIWSTSPHFHLVDRGHKLVGKNGTTLGFVQGKHFLASTAQEVEAEVVPAEIEKMYADISKKMGD